MDSPGKMVAIIVVVVLALGIAGWSIMNAMKGPQDHINMTGAQMIQREREARGLKK